jgi:Rod binding domain-containing protein
MDLPQLRMDGAKAAVDPDRARAEKTAAQFEQIFVRTMVQSLRATSSLGEGGGMFGDGPGADTFGDWFDANLTEQISRTSRIGIEEALIADLERHGQIPVDLDVRTQAARNAANVGVLRAAKAQGGLDVVL